MLINSTHAKKGRRGVSTYSFGLCVNTHIQPEVVSYRCNVYLVCFFILLNALISMRTDSILKMFSMLDSLVIEEGYRLGKQLLDE